jgi:hypothetical protein
LLQGRKTNFLSSDAAFYAAQQKKIRDCGFGVLVLADFFYDPFE